MPEIQVKHPQGPDGDESALKYGLDLGIIQAIESNA
jgi:hypothetical protein